MTRISTAHSCVGASTALVVAKRYLLSARLEKGACTLPSTTPRWMTPGVVDAAPHQLALACRQQASASGSGTMEPGKLRVALKPAGTPIAAVAYGPAPRHHSSGDTVGLGSCKDKAGPSFFRSRRPADRRAFRFVTPCRWFYCHAFCLWRIARYAAAGS